MASQPYNYSGGAGIGLTTAISPTRFATYSQSAKNHQDALRLYTWNTAVSAAFYGPLQALEIALRNAVHSAMSVGHDQNWLQTGQVLRQSEQHTVKMTTRRLSKAKKQINPDSVVSELTFGFWVALFANVYDTSIWRTDLFRVFLPRIKNRSHIHDVLDRLRTLRNRIAHHEPIFQRNLQHDYDRIRQIVVAVNRPTLNWLDYHSRVPNALAQKPHAVRYF
ncbi:Abi family protein [Candidatus Poriferisodalis sp.]|uniref:Abi family protein n=1 Tax=Candidatus Poriferisodalis sp. TaxID=3101277 RepID=UPI003B01DF5D